MYIPDYLTKLGNKHPEHLPWLDSLPKIILKVSRDWNLTLDKPFLEHATCSYVAPCLTGEGKQAVLKIGLPHEEALHEIEGLQVLKGTPTVRLLNFDKVSNAMLLERCIPGVHLASFPERRQDEVICGLLPQIWEASYPKNNFRPLAEMVEQWNKETYEDLDKFPDPILAKEACLLKEELVASTRRQVLLATDLHAGNVLQAQRKDWLVIDIKPYIGDPAYDLTQHLLNCKERLHSDPGQTIHRLAKLSEISVDRLKDWIFARLASENGGRNQALALKIKAEFG